MKKFKTLLIINCVITILLLVGCSERKVEIKCEEVSPNGIYTAWLDDDNLKVNIKNSSKNIYLKVDIFKFINIQYLDE